VKSGRLRLNEGDCELRRLRRTIAPWSFVDAGPGRSGVGAQEQWQQINPSIFAVRLLCVGTALPGVGGGDGGVVVVVVMVLL
jgi:hypothetical protein